MDVPRGSINPPSSFFWVGKTRLIVHLCINCSFIYVVCVFRLLKWTMKWVFITIVKIINRLPLFGSVSILIMSSKPMAYLRLKLVFSFLLQIIYLLWAIKVRDRWFPLASDQSRFHRPTRLALTWKGWLSWSEIWTWSRSKVFFHGQKDCDFMTGNMHPAEERICVSIATTVIFIP